MVKPTKLSLRQLLYTQFLWTERTRKGQDYNVWSQQSQQPRGKVSLALPCPCSSLTTTSSHILNLVSMLTLHHCALLPPQAKITDRNTPKFRPARRPWLSCDGAIHRWSFTPALIGLTIWANIYCCDFFSLKLQVLDNDKHRIKHCSKMNCG